MYDYEINRVTVALGTAILLSVSGLAYAVVKAHEHREAVEVDQDSLCLTNQPLTAHTHVVLDKTDPYTPAQAEFIRRTINQIKDKLAVNELLTLSFLTSDLTGFTKIRNTFVSCAPPKGEEANPLYENPRLIRKRFEQGFEEPFEEMLAQLAVNAEYPTSPILEFLEAVTDLKGFEDENVKTRLVIFSDGLQNTDTLSHYVRSPYHAEIAPGFTYRNTEVIWYYLIRPETYRFQTEENRSFWRAYLKEAGVKHPEVVVQKRF